MLLFGRISVQKTFLKKGITFAVIVLFIGMIVIPSTGRIPETVYTVSSDGNTMMQVMGIPFLFLMGHILRMWL